MNLVLGGLCEPLLVTGGFGGAGAAATFVLYVDPRQTTLVPEDTSIGDIDPTQVAIIQ